MTTTLSSVQLVAPAELCAATARLWRDRLSKEIRDTHEEACIDMSNTRFIDSSGLGVLIGVNKSMRARGGILKILNPTAAVTQLIELTRLHRVLDIIRA
ncbi:MAG: STAS domain-containing protein [Prosthecobacter sp.]|uniref:STAS domain-containing protein n=1 Tax=Prosthecobacter sp. TaxID=1965333 RepID=UPI00390424A0